MAEPSPEKDGGTNFSGGELGGGEFVLQGQDLCHLFTDECPSKSREPNRSNVAEPNRSNESELNRNNEDMVEEPRLGMEFISHDSAYKFYLNYGEKTGFKVRKQHRRLNVKGIVTSVTYCCSKEGYRRKDKRRVTVSYTQPVSRVGCEAHMTCLIQKNDRYKVVSFNASHNHQLGRLHVKQMPKIEQRVSVAQKAHAGDVVRSAIPVQSAAELMSRHVAWKEHNRDLDEDCRSYIHKRRATAMQKGDAVAILHYLQKMQLENLSSFYSIQLDEDDKITNVFWADARSISDYGLFGDVVCFDTSYRFSGCCRPFAPFIGVNHHKQTVVFGAALLYDETIESFQWLFQNFLAAMSGKQPKTILTDQSVAMAQAISNVFPETQHRLCVWHMYQKCMKNLNTVFRRSTQFNYDFSKCIYDYEDADEWLLAWNQMLEKYGLKENKWLKDIFEVKEKWASVYGRHIFTADIKTTQRSESMSSILKKNLMHGNDFVHFFEDYERLLKDRRYDELCADSHMMQTKPVLISGAEMLQHALEVYTPEVFELFQKEYIGILECSISKVDKSWTTTVYKISYAGKCQEHLVKYDASIQSVMCSCLKFFFVGILCCHALKVLDKKNVRRIPTEYILKRWTREAKARYITNYNGKESDENPKECMSKRVGYLCRNFREIASFAAEHEQLTAYVHKHSVELLKGLEELKRKLFLEKTGVDNSSEDKHIIVESEQVAAIELKETTEVCGVKRKATLMTQTWWIERPS